MRILFLCSGNGGNLKFVHIFSKTHNEANLGLGFKVIGVIADRDCGAIHYAQKNKLLNEYHSFKRSSTENDKLISKILKHKPDVIVTNVHKIISPIVLDRFKGKFINIHYSILPSFAGQIGMESTKKAIQSGCKFLGSTCHDVTEKLDLGPILTHSIFAYKNQKNVFDLVFKTGTLALLSGIIQKKYDLNQIHTYGEILTNPFLEIDNTVLNQVYDKLTSIK